MINDTDEQLMDRAKATSDIGTTYVISNKFGLIKVGNSDRVNERLKEIESMSGVPCKLEYTIKGSKLEKKFHRDCSEFRTVGEWFDYPIEKAINKLKELKESEIENTFNILAQWRESEKISVKWAEEKRKEADWFNSISNDICKGEVPECDISESRIIRRLALRKLIDYFGNASKLAEYLGTKASTVSGWQSRGQIGRVYADIISEDPELNVIFPITLMRFGLKR